MLHHVLAHFPVAGRIRQGLRWHGPDVVKLPIDCAHAAVFDELITQAIEMGPSSPNILKFKLEALALLHLCYPEIVVKGSLVADLVDWHFVVVGGYLAYCPSAFLAVACSDVWYLCELAPVSLGQHAIVV